MDNSDILNLIRRRQEAAAQSSKAEKQFFDRVREESKDFIDLLRELQMMQIQVDTFMYNVYCNQFVRVDGGITVLFTTRGNGGILIRDLSVSMVPVEEPKNSKKKSKAEPEKRPPYIEATLEGYSKVPLENKAAFLDIISNLIRDKKKFLEIERNTIKAFYESEVNSQVGLLNNWQNRLNNLK